VHDQKRLPSNTPHAITRVGFEGEDDDSLPDEACGPIITPAEKSASQARRAPKIGERSRENEAPCEVTQLLGLLELLELLELLLYVESVYANTPTHPYAATSQIWP
jgi:hypothetical protein